MRCAIVTQATYRHKGSATFSVPRTADSRASIPGFPATLGRTLQERTACAGTAIEVPLASCAWRHPSARLGDVSAALDRGSQPRDSDRQRPFVVGKGRRRTLQLGIDARRPPSAVQAVNDGPAEVSASYAGTATGAIEVSSRPTGASASRETGST